MDVTAWEEPTARRESTGASWAVAETLKAHKGVWAIIEQKPAPADEVEAKKQRAAASNRASLIKQGRLAPFQPRGTFEAVSRTYDVPVTDGEGNETGETTKETRVYARYLGEEFARPAPEPKPRKPKADAATPADAGSVVAPTVGADGPIAAPEGQVEGGQADLDAAPAEAVEAPVGESIPGQGDPVPTQV